MKHISLGCSFCCFFCFQSGALTLAICCVLELKHAICWVVGLKSLMRVAPHCFYGFHWFCHGVHVFVDAFGWTLHGLHSFFHSVHGIFDLFCWFLDAVGWFLHGLSDFSMDFIDVAMVFIKFCMCSLILAWFSKVYLGIHDVHKSNCKYLAVNPYIYILIYIYIYIYYTIS